MRLEYQIAAAFALDLLLGDPRWMPHPVRLIGRFALALEAPLRRGIRNARAAGIVAVAIVLGATGAVAFLLVEGAARLHPIAGDVVSVFLLYTAFAARDLAHHSHRVYRALAAGDLAEARRRVALMVGRDTASLDEPGVVRAAVESVAENMVDGVTAPIFFAALGGPVGALLYKAVNTLDSTFGYKNERYLDFGRASARLDDFVNWLPARLTAPLTAAAAWLLGLDAGNSWRIFRRDGRKHPSPNSGLAEAAVAGALGVQLGGVNFYGGRVSERLRMGDALRPLEAAHIPRANALMFAGSFLALLLFAGARAAVTQCSSTKGTSFPGISLSQPPPGGSLVPFPPPLRGRIKVGGANDTPHPILPPQGGKGKNASLKERSKMGFLSACLLGSTPVKFYRKGEMA